MRQIKTEESNPSTDVKAHPASARKKLVAASSLHWFHWVIVGLSLLLTFFAWSYSKSELEARVKAQFDREADQVAELILERMRKYEDALWGGVALIRTTDDEVQFQQWKTYADSIDIEKKYPGINGIGVIHAVSEDGLEKYLAQQRSWRPDFKIYPQHDGDEYYPISYVIPLKENDKAVGLDMAHEMNRFTAAKQARDTGTAQITGPIFLVQDSVKTPGFLFYAPFYEGGTHDNVNARQTKFTGMVYAPFTVSRLMQGVLEKDKRHVGIRLADGDQVLYDEHVDAEEDYDADPLFKKSVDVPLYGRTWTFDIWSANSFREAASDTQPLTILLGGLAIDGLLIFLFLSISRASHKALGYADSMTGELELKTQELQDNQAELAERAKQLETSNAELEQFAYVASHDLQEPLRKIASYGQLLREECGESFTEDGHEYLDVVINAAGRLKTLVTDLLAFSRITTRGQALAPVSADRCLRQAIDNLEFAISDCDAQVTCEALPEVLADESQLTLLFQNLIGNAIKYRGERVPEIHIGGRDLGVQYEIFVQDNGIGIEEKFYQRIFEIFQRLHNRRDYSGTGIGLAVCKRIVDRFGGRIWVDSVAGQGSKFYFTITQVGAKVDSHDYDHDREQEFVGASH